METKTLIEITSSALHDILCEGCGEDVEKARPYPYGSSCYECREYAAKEVANRLRELDALREIIQKGYDKMETDKQKRTDKVGKGDRGC